MSTLITIEHSIEELNTILTALAERPFKEVASLIVKIKSLAEAQMGAAQAPAPATSDEAPAPTETPAA